MKHKEYYGTMFLGNIQAVPLSSLKQNFAIPLLKQVSLDITRTF